MKVKEYSGKKSGSMRSNPASAECLMRDNQPHYPVKAFREEGAQHWSKALQVLSTQQAQTLAFNTGHSGFKTVKSGLQWKLGVLSTPEDSLLIIIKVCIICTKASLRTEDLFYQPLYKQNK